MRDIKYLFRIVAICLFVLSCVILLVPDGKAEEFSNITIPKDDHWSHRMESPQNYGDEDIHFEISVTGSNERSFDVYVMSSKEYDHFKDMEQFSADTARQNITFVHKIKFTSEWERRPMYLIVDNMDNAREGDAYANETIVVDITVDKMEDEEEDEIGQAILIAIAGMCGLAVLIAIGILLWIALEPRYFPQAKSKKLRDLTRKPAFQHMPLNPPADLGSTHRTPRAYPPSQDLYQDPPHQPPPPPPPPPPPSGQYQSPLSSSQPPVIPPDSQGS